MTLRDKLLGMKTIYEDEDSIIYNFAKRVSTIILYDLEKKCSKEAKVGRSTANAGKSLYRGDLTEDEILLLSHTRNLKKAALLMEQILSEPIEKEGLTLKKIDIRDVSEHGLTYRVDVIVRW